MRARARAGRRPTPVPACTSQRRTCGFEARGLVLESAKALIDVLQSTVYEVGHDSPLVFKAGKDAAEGHVLLIRSRLSAAIAPLRLRGSRTASGMLFDWQCYFADESENPVWHARARFRTNPRPNPPWTGAPADATTCPSKPGGEYRAPRGAD